MKHLTLVVNNFNEPTIINESTIIEDDSLKLVERSIYNYKNLDVEIQELNNQLKQLLGLPLVERVIAPKPVKKIVLGITLQDCMEIQIENSVLSAKHLEQELKDLNVEVKQFLINQPHPCPIYSEGVLAMMVRENIYNGNSSYLTRLARPKSITLTTPSLFTRMFPK